MHGPEEQGRQEQQQQLLNARRNGRDDPRGRRGAVAAVERAPGQELRVREAHGQRPLVAAGGVRPQRRRRRARRAFNITRGLQGRPGVHGRQLHARPTAWLANELHDRRGGHY